MPSFMKLETQVVIVGAGIAGLSSAIYLKRGNVDFLLLDKGTPGGKLNNIHKIENYPGFSSVSGPDLASKLLEQAQNLGICVQYGLVAGILKEANGFCAYTEEDEIHCKGLIIATGLSNRTETVKGEKEFLGKGVSYCATCDGNFFKGKDVAVIGYEDHAVEDVIYLSGLARKVYFFLPKSLETPDSHRVSLLSLPNVELHEDSSLVSVDGSRLVEKVTVAEQGSIKEYCVSGVFPLFGEAPSSSLTSSLGLETKNGFIVANENLETSVPGVYACGDVVNKKLRQLVTASSDGAIAATSAIAFLRKANAF